MNYCAGWIRQQENQQLGIPREIARGFSPRLRELCGYGIYSRLIGHIDKRSPVEMLDAPRRGAAPWSGTVSDGAVAPPRLALAVEVQFIP